MRTMLRLRERYADEYNVVFNGSKSKCIIPYSFSMSGSMIDNVDSWLHLGYNIINNGSDKVAISNCPSSFTGQDNYAICWFNVLDCDIETQLLKIIVQVCMIVNLTVWL